MNEWVKNLVLYEDGRFATDKFWSFFAVNYSSRKRNQTSGGYYVDGFFDGGPKSLDELQNEIRNGDTSWVDRISYFSHRVHGSPGFWRNKRSELYSWINYHVNMGHGGPTMFLTFSCAEYHWPDIVRLIKDRYAAAGSPPPDLEGMSMTTLINDFTLVVQEYFQARMELWLDTVGRTVFGIKHYWLRYEFAPGRGQIHAHMLAIPDDKTMMLEYHRLKGDKVAQAAFLGKYTSERFKYTAMLPEVVPARRKRGDPHPSDTYLGDQEDREADAVQCLMCTQQHVCSDYCLRTRRQT